MLNLTNQQAIKLAIECMERRIHKIAFDANLADQYNDTAPTCVKASSERQQLKQAISILGNTQQQLSFIATNDNKQNCINKKDNNTWQKVSNQ